MNGRARSIGALSVGVLLAAVELFAGPKFTSTWMAPEAAGTSFAGKKVAALVITTDAPLQISSEEALTRELTARGLDVVPTYRMAPREELVSVERARPWFERANVEGVVALRPVSVDREKTYTPTVWTTTSYSTLWGYYGYSTTAVYTPGSVREDTTLVVETLIYSVPLDKLLWAGASTTTNPKKAPEFIRELVNEAVKEMRKQKLVK
jgi:hypothetical protein